MVKAATSALKSEIINESLNEGLLKQFPELSPGYRLVFGAHVELHPGAVPASTKHLIERSLYNLNFLT